MNYDKKYYGIYSGFVEDTNDPLDKGRIKFRCPQVLGDEDKAVSNWAKPVGGRIADHNTAYGTYYTTAVQPIGVNTATMVDSWVTADAVNTYAVADKIYVEETGDYFVQFAANVTKSNASAGTIDVWFTLNGSAISNSNTRVSLSGNGAQQTMTAAFIFDLTAGDYLEFFASAGATNVFIEPIAAGVAPATPGVIATLNLIGRWTPKYKQPIWVSFQGGDPDFPLWIGAQS